MYRSIAKKIMSTEILQEELSHEAAVELRNEIINEVYNPENVEEMEQKEKKMVEVNLKEECGSVDRAHGGEGVPKGGAGTGDKG